MDYKHHKQMSYVDREHQATQYIIEDMAARVEKEIINNFAKTFFEALRQKTLLIIIDTASKNEKAVFSLVSLKDGKMLRFSPMLRLLGFKEYRQQGDLFVTYCAGRFSLYILDNVGNKLRGNGIELPNDFYNLIQYQYCI